MARKDYDKLAAEIIEKIGGKENIGFCFHCATRLRFTLKDRSAVNDAGLNAVSGVLGTKDAGGMFQVIIGQDVEKVYDKVCELAGLSKEKAIDENLDQKSPETRKGIRGLVDSFLTYVVGTMTPIIGVLIGASLWSAIGLLLGPQELNIISADSGFYITCNLIFRAFFYFLPIYVGYSAAKQLKISNPVWGMAIGALLVIPEFAAMVGTTETFQLFGFIPVSVVDYGQTVFPVLLGVFVFKYIYKFLSNLIPEVISMAVVPLVCYGVMIILMLAVFGPLGNLVGTGFNVIFSFMATTVWPVRMLGFVLLTAAWPFITLCGMHLPISITMFVNIMTTGSDAFAMACMVAASGVWNGMSLAAVLKMKTKDDRSMAVSAAISTWFGAISEPVLYGIALRTKSAIKTLIGCGIIAGLIAAVLQPVCYTIVAGGGVFAIAAPWVGGAMSNIYKGVGLSVACSVVGFIGTLLFTNFDKNAD